MWKNNTGNDVYMNGEDNKQIDIKLKSEPLTAGKNMGVFSSFSLKSLNQLLILAHFDYEMNSYSYSFFVVCQIGWADA